MNEKTHALLSSISEESIATMIDQLGVWDDDEVLGVPAKHVDLDDTLLGFPVGAIAKASHNGAPARRFSLMHPEGGDQEVGRLVILEDVPVLVVRSAKVE